MLTELEFLHAAEQAAAQRGIDSETLHRDLSPALQFLQENSFSLENIVTPDQISICAGKTKPFIRLLWKCEDCAEALVELRIYADGPKLCVHAEWEGPEVVTMDSIEELLILLTEAEGRA